MNIEITESRDADLVYSISKQVSDGITNDEWAALDEAVRVCHTRLLVENPKNHTLCVSINGQSAGCFLLEFKADDLLCVHTMLLSTCRGHSAILAGRRAMQMVASLFGIHRLESYCPMNKREILFFALRCGFKKAETIVGGWIKNGVAYDLVRVEATV